jgi:hypothetical protein
MIMFSTDSFSEWSSAPARDCCAEHSDAVRFWLDVEPHRARSPHEGTGASRMTALDLHVLAERVAAVERHLARVEAKLPASVTEFQPSSDASDAVILHLWQAAQIVIDLAWRARALGLIWMQGSRMPISIVITSLRITCSSTSAPRAAEPG